MSTNYKLLLTYASKTKGLFNITSVLIHHTQQGYKLYEMHTHTHTVATKFIYTKLHFYKNYIARAGFLDERPVLMRNQLEFRLVIIFSIH